MTGRGTRAGRVADGRAPRSARRRRGGALVLLAVVLALVCACAPQRTAPPDKVDASVPSGAREPAYPGAADTGANGDLPASTRQALSTPGATLEDVVIHGQVTISADDVTLRNVRVESDEAYGILVTGKRAVIEQVSVEGTPGTTTAGVATDQGGSFHATALDVSRSEDGVRLGDDCVLEKSYVHDLEGSAASHFDGVTADGFRRWRISGNTIVNDHPQTAAVWIGDPRYGGSEGVLEGNYLAGGGWTLYAGPGVGAGLKVTDNAFSTRFHPLSGLFGAVTAWISRGNTWTGNVWADGPRRGRAVPAP